MSDCRERAIPHCTSRLPGAHPRGPAPPSAMRSLAGRSKSPGPVLAAPAPRTAPFGTIRSGPSLVHSGRPPPASCPTCSRKTTPAALTAGARITCPTPRREEWHEGRLSEKHPPKLRYPAWLCCLYPPIQPFVPKAATDGWESICRCRNPWPCLQTNRQSRDVMHKLIATEPSPASVQNLQAKPPLKPLSTAWRASCPS